MPASIQYLKGDTPGPIGRIAELHGAYYASVWGHVRDFEIKVARELSDFVEAYDPAHDLLLTVSADGRIVGSVAIVGHGIGTKRLIDSITFCRACRFRRLHLWTVANLPESLHLYNRFGFEITERFTNDRWSILLEHLRLELGL